MSCVRERLVKRPEHARKALGVLRDRLREVRALRRHRADQGHRAFAARQYLRSAASFIEFRQSGGQIRGEALFRGHLLQSSRDFSERFCPSRGGVRHHCDVIPHVAVVFRQRDTRVDRSLTRCDRHVGGVGDQHRSVCHGTVGLRVDQLREFVQYLAHLVAALAAADVDDDIRVAPLRQLVLVHRLACTEAAGDRRRAALRDREQRIHHALTGDQRDRGR